MLTFLAAIRSAAFCRVSAETFAHIDKQGKNSDRGRLRLSMLYGQLFDLKYGYLSQYDLLWGLEGFIQGIPNEPKQSLKHTLFEAFTRCICRSNCGRQLAMVAHKDDSTDT